MTVSETATPDVEGPDRVLTCVCIADSDTRLKWTVRVAERIVDRMVERIPGVDRCSIVVVSLSAGAVPTEQQLADHQVSAPHLVLGDDDLPALLADADVVIVNTVGSRLSRIIGHGAALADEIGRRPVVITGYAGLVYEKYVEGLVWRLGADVICCNSLHDLELFRSLAVSLGADPSPLVAAGVAVAALDPGTTSSPRPWPPERVVFAVQPDVPRRLDDRVYLLERLVSYARAHRDREVVVKLRSRLGELTTHREKHHYEQLYRRHVVDRPANLRFEYGHMGTLLDTTDLLVTVSSTAAVEALARGVHVGIITDLGIGESMGNHLFIGSGLLVSMNDVDIDRRPVLDVAWAARNGLRGDERPEVAADRVIDLLVGASDGRPLPTPVRLVTSERMPRLFSRVVESASGYPPSASPVAEGRSRRVRRRVGRLVHSAARRCYRSLVRWADL